MFIQKNMCYNIILDHYTSCDGEEGVYTPGRGWDAKVEKNISQVVIHHVRPPYLTSVNSTLYYFCITANFVFSPEESVP